MRAFPFTLKKIAQAVKASRAMHLPHEERVHLSYVVYERYMYYQHFVSFCLQSIEMDKTKGLDCSSFFYHSRKEKGWKFLQ